MVSLRTYAGLNFQKRSNARTRASITRQKHGCQSVRKVRLCRHRVNSGTGSAVVCRQKSMKLTMRDRSQRPQLSVAAAEVGWGRLDDAQPLNKSDSTNASPTAKEKIPHQLPSFMPFLHLSEALTVMLQPFSQQEASHEQNINIRHTLHEEAGVGPYTNRHVRCRYFGFIADHPMGDTQTKVRTGDLRASAPMGTRELSRRLSVRFSRSETIP